MEGMCWRLVLERSVQAALGSSSPKGAVTLTEWVPGSKSLMSLPLKSWGRRLEVALGPSRCVCVPAHARRGH